MTTITHPTRLISRAFALAVLLVATAALVLSLWALNRGGDAAATESHGHPVIQPGIAPQDDVPATPYGACYRGPC
jgi:hypothetical protein